MMFFVLGYLGWEMVATGEDEHSAKGPVLYFKRPMQN